MSPPPGLLETLTSLTASLTATATSLQSPDFPSPMPPENGISLLGLKNELLLSYIHNVVFLVLVRLRSGSLADGVGAEAVKELVKLRVLLERGVKPLEGKLKYQIDKVITASTGEPKIVETKVEPAKKNDEDEVEGVEHDDYSRRQIVRLDDVPVSSLVMKELAFRPNPAALAKPSAPALSSTNGKVDDADGVYRPPRMSATMMPEPGKPEKEKSGRRKSHMLDEFVADEFSTAPTAEPSIGSTIVDSGRVVKTARDRREEKERQEYEESNFVRLPRLSKKEAREQKRRGGREASGAGMGGEDWTSFAGDVESLTKGVDKASRSLRLLEKSRKRRGDGEDGENGGSGSGRVGESFERRKERFAKRRKT